MQLIIATIKPGESGPIVANLQDALFALLEHQIIRALDAPNQPTLEVLEELAEILKKEREQSVFGKATQRLITYFQIQQGLGDHLFGVVENTTAERLNQYLEKLDLLKNDSNFIVKGRIFDKEDGKAVTDVIVRAFDWYKEVYTLLGETSTDQKGLYQIEFLEKTFKNIASDRKNPDLIMRIYDQKNKQIDQSKLVDQAERITELDVEVTISPFRVYGVVLDSTGKPVQNANVKAFDRDLRTVQMLGDTITDAVGHYEIGYSRQKFVRSEKDAADLEIHVFDDKDALLVKSETMFNAPAEIEINLVAHSAEILTEWERITQGVLPLLEGQGVQPLELESTDIDFIVNDTQIDREQLRLWIAAARTAHDIMLLHSINEIPSIETHHIPDNTSFKDSAEWILFYGWYRDGQPQDFSALLRLSSNTLLSSLDRAIEQHYIPAFMIQLKEHVQASLEARKISEALKPSLEGQPASFGDVFRTMSQSALLQLDKPDGIGAQIVSVLVKATSNLDEQWKNIHELVGSSELFNSVRRSVGLMQLTDGYQPMIAALQLVEADDAAAMLADLVKYDSQQWIDFAKQWGAPLNIDAPSDDERSMIYGQQLAQKIEFMHPAPYIRHRVLSEQIPLVEEHRGLIDTFLNANPDMRIKDGSILVWLESDKVKFGSLTEEQIKKITPEVLRIERVAKITPSLEYVGPLLKSGYESARDIVLNRAREVFVDEISNVIT